MELIPRVLSNIIDTDSLIWICHKNLCYEIPPAVRDEPRQSVVCTKDFLVEIRRLLVLGGFSNKTDIPQTADSHRALRRGRLHSSKGPT